jgi:hypothetical protein
VMQSGLQLQFKLEVLTMQVVQMILHLCQLQYLDNKKE